VNRLRVLISAYAFGPCDESEANAAWAFACAAARDHDVWVLARPRFADSIEAALAADAELRAHLTVEYLDYSRPLLLLKRGPLDVYWYYLLWQRLVTKAARRLQAEIGFDVAHHVTFASDWLPCGLRRLRDVPLVWGPVGGSTYLPWRLIRWVGLRGGIGEVARSVLSRAGRRLWGDPTARRAVLVVAQNPDVAKRFGAAHRVVLETNSATPDDLPSRRSDSVGTARHAVFVGRLAEWKGCRLAVSALARPEAANWTLDVYGTGRDLPAVQALVEKLELGDRVTLRGHRPRTEALAALAQADAMLFPSMHDSAPWAVGEASAIGCPVVCLDLGGPPFLAGPNAVVVSHTGDVVGGLARGLADAADRTGVPSDRWSAARLPDVLSRWYAYAAGQRPDPD
jgi:glycosyltransferase involved in cell wall biosynthesis